MTEENVTRKLTAILYADVAGYSRLTGEDEVGTHRQLSAGLDLISGAIEEAGGRVVHYAGDAVLAEFASVVAAVETAVGIQRQLAEDSADIPDDKRLEFRIGVNLGEVIVDRDDIYGDGVNVAARLESLAEPGGVCVSRTVYNHIKGKVDLGFEDLGEQKVKNISEPVQVYRVKPDDTDTRNAPPGTAGEALPIPDKPSIAVLPFDNMSGDPEQEYFVDGVAEDIITTLSRIPQLLVIARNSTFAYKGKSPDVRQVGRELGVRYVLEGSGRHASGRVRVVAQLIDATTGNHLWAERYDRNLDDVFAVQDEIAKEVVTALEVKLTRGEQARLWRKRAGNLEAYEYFQRGRDLYMTFNREANGQAIHMLTRALELSPEFTNAMAYLGWAHVGLAQYGWSKSPKESYGRAEELGNRIVEIDDTCGSGHALLASVHLRNGRYDDAIAEAEEAVALEPNGADMYHILALTCGYAGRFEDTVHYEKQALRLSPLAPENSLTELGRAYCHLERPKEAIQVLMRGLESRPYWMTFRTLLVFAYVEAGESNEAEEQVAEILRMKPKFSVANWAKAHFYKDSAELERYMNALRKAGLPE